MIRLGILDFDTSHVVEFTKRLNHIDVAETQFVEGAKVVVGCVGESKIYPDLIAGYAAQMTKYGVPLVEKPTQMIGRVDAVLIESNEGGVHYERAKPFLEAGLPCFIDKPFTCSTDDAKKLIDLAAKKNVALFSASALRYAPELVAYLADPKRAPLAGCSVFGPASLHARNPGLFHYGIHPVEMLYTLMGPGCLRVSCLREKGAEVATGVWKDGRVASLRGTRPAGGYGFTAFTDKGTHTANATAGTIYRDLLRNVVATFQTGKPPFDVNITLEIVAFIVAANASADNHGTPVTVRT